MKFMTRSEFIEKVADRNSEFSTKDIELAIKSIINCMVLSLEKGERIEIRGFGSFGLQFYLPRVGRNPRTGERINLPTRVSLRFRPGKALRDQVNGAWLQGRALGYCA